MRGPSSISKVGACGCVVVGGGEQAEAVGGELEGDDDVEAEDGGEGGQDESQPAQLFPVLHIGSIICDKPDLPQFTRQKPHTHNPVPAHTRTGLLAAARPVL